MKFLKSIAALLRRGVPSFSVLETALLTEIERHLDVDRAERLRRRVESINLVQRLDGGREVNAYVLYNRKPVFDEATRLVADDNERKLAVFSFINANRFSYEGTAWLVNGQLFSLEFNNTIEHDLNEYPMEIKLKICI